MGLKTYIRKKILKFLKLNKPNTPYGNGIVNISKSSDIHPTSCIHGGGRVNNCKIGKYTSIGPYTWCIDAEIGSFCSISHFVEIGAASHPIDRITTNAFTYSTVFGFVDKTEPFEPIKTIIGNDVWLGCKTSILSGVKVGHGAIVGAGAVVTKDVPPYAIVAGVPAKVLRYRFDKEIIEKLLELKWWDFEKEFLAQHIELFKQDLTIELIDDLSCKYKEYKAKTLVAVERESKPFK